MPASESYTWNFHVKELCEYNPKKLNLKFVIFPVINFPTFVLQFMELVDLVLSLLFNLPIMIVLIVPGSNMSYEVLSISDFNYILILLHIQWEIIHHQNSHYQST